MLISMPKRKAKKCLFSSDDARRKAARVELETEDERCERLRTTLKKNLPGFTDKWLAAGYASTCS